MCLVNCLFTAYSKAKVFCRREEVSRPRTILSASIATTEAIEAF